MVGDAQIEPEFEQNLYYNGGFADSDTTLAGFQVDYDLDCQPAKVDSVDYCEGATNKKSFLSAGGQTESVLFYESRGGTDGA